MFNVLLHRCCETRRSIRLLGQGSRDHGDVHFEEAEQAARRAAAKTIVGAMLRRVPRFGAGEAEARAAAAAEEEQDTPLNTFF